MTRRMFATIVLVTVVLIGSLTAADDKPTSIKEVMANHKKNQLRQQVETGLKADSPDWPALQKLTKKYAAQAKELDKFNPPKGDKEDYVKLAKAFSASITDLDKATQAKDSKAANAALQKSGTYCAKCHQEHKPK